VDINPKMAFNKIKKYSVSFEELQKHYIIFQKFTSHNGEFRTVKIGEDYFSYYKKMVKGICSGTKNIEFFNPSENLLNFSKYVFDTGNFQSMSLDILDIGNDVYYVNELQTIFGHIKEHILMIENKPGKLKFKNKKWEFEEGIFNSNQSFNLRLKNVIEKLGKTLHK